MLPVADPPEILPWDEGPGLPSLPYAPIACPPYRETGPSGAGGVDWRFAKFLLPVCPGYFGGPRRMRHACFALSRGAVTWMSLTPMEAESMAPGIDAASGRVVVGGMGLGLAAFAIAMKESVEKVTVVELDPAVVEMARGFAQIDAWPCAEKIEIVTADLAAHRDPAADFLFVDIWPSYRMDAMVLQMRAFHRAIPAARVFYWGQELDAVDRHLAQGGVGGEPLDGFDAGAFEAFREEVGLPLVGLEQAAYPALCRRAAVNPAIGAARRPIEPAAAPA